MTLVPVKSGAIQAIGHEGDTLTVQFASGARYTYQGVTAEHFDALLKAPSIGKHFAATVRNGDFVTTKLDPDPEAEAE